MKTISLKEHFEKFLTPFNPAKGSLRSWRIDTIAGPLELEFMDNEKPWIACVFMDVEKAKELLKNSTRLNTYSGKWNWHTFEFGNFSNLTIKRESEISGQIMIGAFFEKLNSIKDCYNRKVICK